MLETGGGKELDGCQTAEVPPMVSIRRESNGCVIVPKNFAGKGFRLVGEDDIVLGETFFGCRGRGNEENWAAAEMKI